MVTRRRQQLGALVALILAIAGLGAAVWFARHNHSGPVATGPVGTFTQPGVTTVPSEQIQHTGSAYDTQDYSVTLPVGASAVKEETGQINQLEFQVTGMSARVRSQPLPAGQSLQDVVSTYGLPSQATRITLGGRRGYLFSFPSGDQLSLLAIAGRGQTVYFVQVVSPLSQQAKARRLLEQLGSSATLK